MRKYQNVFNGKEVLTPTRFLYLKNPFLDRFNIKKKTRADV